MSVVILGINSKKVEKNNKFSFPKIIDLPGKWEYGFQLSNSNARVFLTMLGLINQNDILSGECFLWEARRAIMYTRARFDEIAKQFTRDTIKEDNYINLGINKNYLLEKLNLFSEFIEMISLKGGDKIYWA